MLPAQKQDLFYLVKRQAHSDAVIQYLEYHGNVAENARRGKTNV